METQLKCNQNQREKAIVIGGGIAGLLAARVLASHYREVIIIERDELPQEPTSRPGAPQSFHPHRVLPRGNMIMERYFPGYAEELLAQGAHSTENEKMSICTPHGYIEATFPIKNPTSSRALLEWTLRQRVLQIPNVQFRTKQEVTALKTSADHKRVTGVRIKERSEQKLEGTEAADFVVETSGRSSKLIKWLEASGLQVPEAERLKVSLGYSTRHYRVTPDIKKQWGSIISEAQPTKGIGTGMLGYIEEDTAQTLLFSAGGAHYPSTIPDEYEKELEALATPKIAEVIKELEPIGPPRGYRTPESVRQHFEQMEDWPAGLLVLGDAFCSFDPIHGQGMTVAAIEAEVLDMCLSEQTHTFDPVFERKVLQRMQNAIEPAWWLSSIADLRWKGVEHEGAEPLKGVSFVQSYFDLYSKQAVKRIKEENDPSMFMQYFMMNALVVSPQEIINPRVLSMLLKGASSSEQNQLLNELGDVEGEQQIQARLNELIPSFSLAYHQEIINLDAVPDLQKN
ncbi:FAD-dependent oxidoreductase [Paenibacillus vandeheii]